MEIFGDAIYETEPFWWGEGKNFALKKGDEIYLFCFDLARKGSANVTYMSGGEGEYVFKDFPCAVENICWMDNDEILYSSYENGALTVNFTGYPYGTDYCVRVAKGNIKA